MKNKRDSIYYLSIVFISGVLLIFMSIEGILFFLETSWSRMIINVLRMLILMAWCVFFLNRLRIIYSNFIDQVCDRIDAMMNGTYQKISLLNEETLLSKVEYKLQQLFQILESENQCLSKERENLQSLISDISHQVKTPATNLQMALSFLKEDHLSRKEQEEYLKIIEEQIQKLDFLLSALVKSSRLESGVVELKKENLILYDTIAEAVGSVYLKAQKKHFQIHLYCEEQLRVPHDRKWTKEALFNILDNAIKYSEKDKRIQITVEEWERYVKIDITDQGRGISEREQGKIFQRFFRGSGVHDMDGVGIGLYLARDIITRQEGFLKVRSKIGKGSTFSLFLLKN